MTLDQARRIVKTRLRRFKVYVAMSACVLFASTAIIAQDNLLVRGVITDQEENALLGVSIQVEGTDQGTISDASGKFQLSVPQNSRLRFSYLGYQTLILALSDEDSILQVTLTESVEVLEEVVVIGYGIRKKKDVTGATTGLDDQDFNHGIINSPEQLIQGKLPGVELVQHGGEPGSAFSIRIRGTNSIRSGNDPLYVVDGYPLDITTLSPGDPYAGLFSGESSPTNPLAFLNPEDIQSIDVLKDASAAAIYGARGANGVILITTKQGAEGKARVRYKSVLELGQLRKELDLLSADAFRDALGRFGLGHHDLGGNTDWQQEVFRQAFTHRHNLSVSGGNHSTAYRVSANYLDQEGIVNTSELQQINGRANLQQSVVNDRLQFDFQFSFSRMQDRRPRPGIFWELVANNPTLPIFDEEGNYFNPGRRQTVATLELTDDRTTTNHLLANLITSFRITTGLNYRINVGGSNAVATRRASESRLIAIEDNGTATITDREVGNRMIEQYLTYDRTIGNYLTTELLAGYSYQEFSLKNFYLKRGDFPTDEILPVNNIAAAGTEIRTESGHEKNALQSFFGRANLSWKNRYLLTVSLRRDGSTRFGTNNKYGNFPALALGWKLSEEKFLSGSRLLDQLKLRASWGVTGNQEIPNKIAQRVFGFNFDTEFILDETEVPVQGLTLLRTPNANLRWEESRQWDLGLDFSFFRGRLHGAIDYFNKETSGFLLEVLSAAAPTETIFTNVNGSIINNGFEVQLQVIPIHVGKFKWETGLTFTSIKNNVSGLRTLIFTGFGYGPDFGNIQIITNGEPIGTFYGARFLGFDENGFNRFEQNPDGSQRKQVIGHALPDYTFGWSNVIAWGPFSLNFLLTGSQGNDIYSGLFNGRITKQNFDLQGSNITAAILNTDEAVKNSNVFSSRYIFDDSFIRLNYLTLTYQLPARSVSWLAQLQCFLTASNWLVLTDYPGYDPEVQTVAAASAPDRFGQPADIPSLGTDFLSYPRPRSIQFGLQFTFE